MSRRRDQWGLHRRILFGATAALLGCSAGCASASSAEIVSYRDPYFPETHKVGFTRCAYYRDRGKDLHIVAESVRPGDEKLGTVYQWLYIHVFWQPRPGKTYADAWLNDATIEYVIATSSGSATYTGTGFVYPRTRRNGVFDCAIEEARIAIDSTTGAAPELLGAARITGRLFARPDAATARDMQHEMDLYGAGEGNARSRGE